MGEEGENFFYKRMCACFILPDAPGVEPNLQAVIVASSFTQAGHAFQSFLQFAKPYREKYGEKRFRISDSSNHASFEDLESGAKIRCIGSDPQRAHGLNCKIIFADEIAAWPKNSISKMKSALTTQAGKQANSKLICVGTAPSDKDNFFYKMLTEKMVGTYRQVHSVTDITKDLYSVRTWKKSNPSISHPYFVDLLKAIKIEAKRAQKDENEKASFIALRLNAFQSDVIMDFFISPDDWLTYESSDCLVEGRSVWGVDLGTTQSFSCISSMSESGCLRVIAGVGDNPSLEERSKADHQPEDFYSKMRDRGELFVFENCRVIPLKGFIDLAVDLLGQPDKIVIDSWREAEFFDAAAISKKLEPCEIVKRRAGYLDQGNDIRLTRKALLEGWARPRPSLLLRSAIKECRVIRDAAANEKITKSNATRRARGRDDALVSILLCVAEMSRMLSAQEADESQEFKITPLM